MTVLTKHQIRSEQRARRSRRRAARWALEPQAQANWYALRVVSQRERAVIAALGELDLIAYAPLERRYRRDQTRRLPVERPLFSGYVFASLEDRQLHIARSIEGVLGFVLHNGAPARIPAGFIAWFRRAESMGLFDRTRPREKPLQQGDRVRICSGPFGGIFGRVDRLEENGRIRVLMEALGVMGGGPAILPAQHLERVPSQPKRAA